MQVEIVKLYVSKGNEKSFVGTIHVRIKDLKINLRAVRVTYNSESEPSKRFHFYLPTKEGKDQKTGIKVHFPIFEFYDKEMKKQLMKAISSEGRRYIKREYLKIPESPKKEEKITQKKEPIKLLPVVERKPATASLWKRTPIKGIGGSYVIPKSRKLGRKI